MNRTLFVAWRSGGPTQGRWGPVGRLEHEEAMYRFVYTHGARKLDGFAPFPGMPDLTAIYESEELFPLFANRLLARSRPEYDAFLVWGGFDPASPPDPIAVLGVTEGRRETDSLEVFPCPLPDRQGCFVTKFFLHGVRWVGPAGLDRIQQLRPYDRLDLLPEPSNEQDPNAVAVLAAGTADGVRIGYVPRYLARDVSELLLTCDPDFVQLTVERVNKDAPLQHRVLCRMNACWPDTFNPCASEEYQSIVGELSSLTK